jgi:GT2 family glycosyltransferase
MDFSIIIINYKTKELTADCLDSIFSHLTGQFEVLLVDNASNDGSFEFFSKEYGQRVRVFSSKDNLGFSGANNLAAKAAKGDVLLFLNSDTLIDCDILPKLKSALSASGVGIVGPKLLLPDGQEQAFASGSFPSVSGLVFSRLRKAKAVSGPDWISGAALAIRSDLFWRLRGFDEDYFMYFEDIDLCRRAKDIGLDVRTVEDVAVTHLVSRSPSPKRKDFYYRSQDLYFRKHSGILAVVLVRILRTFYLLSAARPGLK